MRPPAVDLAESALGRRIDRWTPVPNRIAGPPVRWRVELAGGGTAFVKASWNDDSAEWLRTERHVYTEVDAPFLPALLGFADAGGAAALVLEDLADATWPPPWTPGLVDRVRTTLGDVAATPPPPGLPRLADLHGYLAASWRELAERPAPFLALGLCEAVWLEDALPVLTAAAAAADLDGDALVHVDVRSDNLCAVGDRVVLVDWSQASVGNPLFDVVEWLPSLAGEGGPAPGTILGHEEAARLAALVAGFFCSRAGLPAPPHLPRLRELQLLQARTALPWAAEALGLPPPRAAPPAP